MKTVDATVLREQADKSREQQRESEAAALRELLPELLGVHEANDAIRLERLQKSVYRLRLGDAGRTFILKRHEPGIAQSDRLVAERWLPALGLEERCPRIFGAAAQREGRWVWHLYEDLTGESLASRRDPGRLGAAVDLMAELHVRGAGHPLLPEVRWHGRDHGEHTFTTALRDGITVLEALARLRNGTPPDFAGTRGRLLDQLNSILEDTPRHARALARVAVRETFLHGDLWPKNILVATHDDETQARLIDWDHVGVGPFTYDVSTLLYQSPAEERPWLLRRYRAAVLEAGWRLPADGELNLLFLSAEQARGATSVLWPALAILNDGAAWGTTALLEIERWFATLRPPLPE